MGKSFTLRWKRKNPATGRTWDMKYTYSAAAAGQGKKQTFRQYVARCIRFGESGGDEFIGEVRGSQIRCPLSKSGYLLLARSPDKTQALLQNGEGGHEVWAKNDDFAGYVVTIRGQGHKFVTSLGSTDATKLARRWRGIDPNEDADLDAGGAAHEREAPPVPERQPMPDEETLMAQFSDAAGVELADGNRELFRQMAQSRLRAMSTATVIPVPPMHDEAQEVEVMRFDGETDEYVVTQDYHNLYAAEGEVTTQRMSDRDHDEMAQIIGNLAVMGYNTSASLAVVAKTVFAGQIFDWNGVQQRAAVLPAELTNSALTTITEVCFVMAEEQANMRPANMPGLPEIHIAPSAGFTVCGRPVKAEDAGPEMRGDLPFIHPKRFLQVGPVPFGPMCGECVEGLRQLESKRGPLLVVEDDELLELIQREGNAGGPLISSEDCPRCQQPGVVFDGVCVNCGEVGPTKAQSDNGQIGRPVAPFPFYACGGCEQYHPLGWAGDCRDDSQRFTAADLDERYGETGWAEVDESTGQPGPDATEGADIVYGGIAKWTLGKDADPVRDTIMALLMTGREQFEIELTEADIRRAVRYFKSTDMFKEDMDEDEVVARLLGHTNTNSEEAVNEKNQVDEGRGGGQ